MEHSQGKETRCKHCGEVFPTKGTYQVHYRRLHQNTTEPRVAEASETTKLRSENDKFECICGNSYNIYQSIYRHQKTCQLWKAHQIEQESSSRTETAPEGKVYI
jgi:hypothetical protein